MPEKTVSWSNLKASLEEFYSKNIEDILKPFQRAVKLEHNLSNKDAFQKVKKNVSDTLRDVEELNKKTLESIVILDNLRPDFRGEIDRYKNETAKIVHQLNKIEEFIEQYPDDVEDENIQELQNCKTHLEELLNRFNEQKQSLEKQATELEAFPNKLLVRQQIELISAPISSDPWSLMNTASNLSQKFKESFLRIYTATSQLVINCTNILHKAKSFFQKNILLSEQYIHQSDDLMRSFEHKKSASSSENI